MKNKITVLLMTAVVFMGQIQNIYADSAEQADSTKQKEIQLTDYRYESAMRGLYGYNFFDGYFWVDRNGDVNSYGSVILKPDGTELFQEGKYYIRSAVNVYGTDNRFCFPQREKRFALTRNKDYRKCIIDEEGREIYVGESDWGFLGYFPNDNTYIYGHGMAQTVPYTSSIDNIGFVNIEEGAEANAYESKNFVMDKSPFMSSTYIRRSVDGRYFKMDYMEQSFYYDALSGVEVECPENIKWCNICFDEEYYGVEQGKGITTDKIDKSYIFKEKSFKEKNYGDVTYYALFKILDDNETAESYKPEEQPSKWAAETIEKATAQGLLYNNSNCRYKENISRHDFAVLAVEAYCKAKGMEVDEYVEKNHIVPGNCKFTDDRNIYVLLANELGIIKGTSDRTFSPDRGLTRQEAAVILNNIAKLSGVKANSSTINYTDSAKFSKWASEAIYNVSGIVNDDGVAVMNGMADGVFSPWSVYSREQAYVSLYRLYEICKE